jgi:hypothetical protein
MPCRCRARLQIASFTISNWTRRRNCNNLEVSMTAGPESGRNAATGPLCCKCCFLSPTRPVCTLRYNEGGGGGKYQKNKLSREVNILRCLAWPRINLARQKSIGCGEAGEAGRPGHGAIFWRDGCRRGRAAHLCEKPDAAPAGPRYDWAPPAVLHPPAACSLPAAFFLESLLKSSGPPCSSPGPAPAPEGEAAMASLPARPRARPAPSPG